MAVVVTRPATPTPASAATSVPHAVTGIACVALEAPNGTVAKTVVAREVTTNVARFRHPLALLRIGRPKGTTKARARRLAKPLTSIASTLGVKYTKGDAPNTTNYTRRA